MAEADRIAAALQYIDEQKPADPFASLKSDPIGALRSAWERKVDPIINNAKRTFATGGVLGDILRAYGEAGAPANRAVLKGMRMPYKDPAVVNTPPTLAPDNSYGNMGDATAQTFGTIIGDPLNFVQPGAARIANALKFAKPDALKMLNEMSQGARSPMDVWHGTPHRFPPTAKNPLGEFDPTKIGTGEGAQAYGVGAAYLAEAKDLAKHYRDVLAIDPRDSVNSVRAALSPSGNKDYWGAGANSPKLDDIYFEMKRHPNLQPYLNDSAFKKDIQKIINGTNPDGTVTDEAINILRRLDKTMPKPSGQLYKVDLADEQIPKMLDWDKPLSQQTPEVQKALSGIESKFPKIPDFNLRKWMDADPLASTWHNALQRDLGVDPAMISNTLKERGITGIRYLDAGSRNTSAGELIGVAKGADGWQAKIRKTPSGQVGDVIPMAPSITTSKSYPTEQAARDWANSQIGGGTSNFVVFDPKHMNIIGRE